jgi:hypothetical protein
MSRDRARKQEKKTLRLHLTVHWVCLWRKAKFKAVFELCKVVLFTYHWEEGITMKFSKLKNRVKYLKK